MISTNGLLTTVAYAFKGQKPVYALEGSIAVAGSAVKFLRDNLGIIKHSAEVGELAAKVKGMDLVPRLMAVEIRLLTRAQNCQIAAVSFLSRHSPVYLRRIG